MKLTRLKIENFRKLIDIDFKCKSSINTIVGPNGVGKSTIIEALRLVKSILLPTYDSEGQQTMQHMGVYSPQTGSVLFGTVCNDINKQTIIKLSIAPSEEEIEALFNKIDELSILRLQNTLGQSPSNRINLVAFLSSPLGQQQLKAISQETTNLLNQFKHEKREANIELVIDKNQIYGKNGFDQEVISSILKNAPLSQTLFSVFPADRNFPTGDVNIQLGQGDLQQQNLSYSIQPNIKFLRLKSNIINQLLLGNNNLELIKNVFKIIFENLIPGKELVGINIDGTTNKLTVLIKEITNGSVFDIDFLSSGEKGLLLTIFLLIRTLGKGGIVIIDEPELHLNPAVSRNIIPFLKKYVVVEKDIQIFLTTHSAEILTSTKDDEDCQLFHIINSTTITPIYKNDNQEAYEAIKSLGITTADLLFNKGVVYLEGTTDEEFINELFKDYTVNFKIQSLGGRGIIENEVKILQAADSKRNLQGFHVFILDFDNKPTELKDSKNVKIIQWDRYSFENYLLNIHLLYDTIKELKGNAFQISSRAEFERKIKSLAFAQIEMIATKETYGNLLPQTITLTNKDFSDNKIPQIAKLLSTKLLKYKGDLDAFNSDEWEHLLIEKINCRINEMKNDWEDNWNKKCKGKELLNAIYSEFDLKSYKDYFKLLVQKNKTSNSVEWQLLKKKTDPIIEIINT